MIEPPNLPAPGAQEPTFPSTKDYDPVDTAWKIHGAQVDWTGKVDSKASFASALETAILLSVFSQTTEKRRLSGLHDWSSTWFAIGLAGLAVSLFLVLLVVIPRLGKRSELKATAKENFIYFGHLKWQTAERVEQSLRDTTDVLPMLSRQLVKAGSIAWRKHRLLQVSLSGTVVSCILIGIAAVMNG